jgi:predicted DNA-binding transcriptional regulator
MGVGTVVVYSTGVERNEYMRVKETEQQVGVLQKSEDDKSRWVVDGKKTPHWAAGGIALPRI